MSTKIRDENFLTPAQINELPCFTADRWLNKVDESVTITQVCQDSDNTSLVIIDFVLVGTFYFTPYCKILSVDGIDYTSNNVSAPLAIGHYSNPAIPIATNCQTFHGKLVFDFGSVIPNYTTATEIVFELGMIGQIPQSYGVSFPNQDCSDEYTWTKGVLPSPVSITYQNGNYNVVFEYAGTKDCSCSIQCIVPSGVSNNVQFCPNEKQTISVYYGDLSIDPSTFIIQLSDSIGNSSVLSVQPLFGVSPIAPSVSLLDNPSRIEVSITPRSINGIELEDVLYQIFRYEGSVSNYNIWKDWSNRSSIFIDTDILPNKTYGYAVRYKGKFGDMTQLSTWYSVTT